MRIYISGKITGLPEEEYKRKFEIAEKKVAQINNHRSDIEIINPCKIAPAAPNPTWHDYMAADIKELLKCDVIYLLKDWGDSRGARCEYALARELDLTIVFEE